MVWKQGRRGKQEEELGGQELNTRMSCPNLEVGAYKTDVQVARPHKVQRVFIKTWSKELLREKVKK